MAPVPPRDFVAAVPGCPCAGGFNLTASGTGDNPPPYVRSGCAPMTPKTTPASATWMERRLDALERRHLLRAVHAVADGAEPWLVVDGRRCLNLSSNNYLGLVGHPEVRAAAADAAQRYGAGAGAARLVSGTHPMHDELERRLAHFERAEAALLYNSGYTANIGVIPALLSDGDTVFGDELNHASIIDGCRLSGATYLTYWHRDVNALETKLKTLDAAGGRGRRMVVTDSVFSMDGDIAPLAGLVELCERYDAMLMIDEAHGTGCLGPGGRGAASLAGVSGRIPVTMGTLSKALGSFGAFISGDDVLREYLVNTSRSFMFTTALPPAVVAASLAALDVLEREPQLAICLQEKAAYFRKGLQKLGFDTCGSQTQIVPVRVGESEKALHLAQVLRDANVFAVAIRPPTVPLGAARVRASIMATHTWEDLDMALAAFGAAGKTTGVLA